MTSVPTVSNGSLHELTYLVQVQAKAAAKTAAMKMRLKAASQTIAAANEHKLQQDSQLMQLQTDLQVTPRAICTSWHILSQKS